LKNSIKQNPRRFSMDVVDGWKSTYNLTNFQSNRL
jgi:hypothetical protein